MVKVISIFIISLLFVTCIKEYKYKIVGTVKINNTLREAIWYTDVIMFKGDTVYYINSDQSIVKIGGSYQIYKNY